MGTLQCTYLTNLFQFLRSLLFCFWPIYYHYFKRCLLETIYILFYICSWNANKFSIIRHIQCHYRYCQLEQQKFIRFWCKHVHLWFKPTNNWSKWTNAYVKPGNPCRNPCYCFGPCGHAHCRVASSRKNTVAIMEASERSVSEITLAADSTRPKQPRHPSKKRYDLNYNKKRINIGDAFERWKQLKAQQDFKKNSELAGFLLDR